eukprot:CAMPEP_0206219132 /NCGR_PEP_ID=MMETSP0047_2-20121206/4161_1 /ASSEMBLY_ACC=CAM_ASM_000192 /TAXON_ID=195065 /ORGANISM="Chroomonas mesostigmatica_cf, Strain CCMP1168" /LENGTH=216 /DNA_ID=CAMNT_0053641665 /DNA_START=416 /DNA_END=1063 /DNA_ORIENTATION=+
MTKTKDAGLGHKNSNGNLIKNLVQGDYYGVRENGFSSIKPSAEIPPVEKDGSNFQPGVDAEMTEPQKRAFFRMQEHDDHNRTMVANIIAHRYMMPNLSKAQPKGSNMLQRNKKRVKETQKLKQATGQARVAMKPHNKEEEAFRILSDIAPMVDQHARPEVLDWLIKASKEEQESFTKIFKSRGGGEVPARTPPPPRARGPPPRHSSAHANQHSRTG